MQIEPIGSVKLAKTGEEYLYLLASDADWIARTADDVRQLRSARDGAFAKLPEADFHAFLKSLLFLGGGVASGSYKPLMASLTLTEIFEVFARFGIGREYVLRIHEERCTPAGTWEFDFWSFCASNCAQHKKELEQEKALQKLSRPFRSGCDVMKDAIKFLAQEIKQKEQRIRVLRTRLEKLQSQPNPNPAQIQEIKQDIQDLEQELEATDRPQLNAFQEEFAASCGA